MAQPADPDFTRPQEKDGMSTNSSFNDYLHPGGYENHRSEFDGSTLHPFDVKNRVKQAAFWRRHSSAYTLKSSRTMPSRNPLLSFTLLMAKMKTTSSLLRDLPAHATLKNSPLKRQEILRIGSTVTSFLSCDGEFNARIGKSEQFSGNL